MHVFTSDVDYLQALVQEASEKGYTSSEVYGDLQATVQDVKKCATTAVQLVSTKPKTRHSNIDVREVKDFLSQVDNLPCKLPEADVLKVCVCMCMCMREREREREREGNDEI